MMPAHSERSHNGTFIGCSSLNNRALGPSLTRHAAAGLDSEREPIECGRSMAGR